MAGSRESAADATGLACIRVISCFATDATYRNGELLKVINRYPILIHAMPGTDVKMDAATKIMAERLKNMALNGKAVSWDYYDENLETLFCSMVNGITRCATLGGEKGLLAYAFVESEVFQESLKMDLESMPAGDASELVVNLTDGFWGSVDNTFRIAAGKPFLRYESWVGPEKHGDSWKMRPKEHNILWSHYSFDESDFADDSWVSLDSDEVSGMVGAFIMDVLVWIGMQGAYIASNDSARERLAAMRRKKNVLGNVLSSKDRLYPPTSYKHFISTVS